MWRRIIETNGDQYIPRRKFNKCYIVCISNRCLWNHFERIKRNAERKQNKSTAQNIKAK